MKQIKLFTLTILLFCGITSANAQTNDASAAISSEMANILHGKTYYGTWGSFRHIWVFKKKGSELFVKQYSSGGKTGFENATDQTGMGKGSPEIPVVVSKVGSVPHLSCIHDSASWTSGGVSRKVAVASEVDIEGNRMTGSGGPMDDKRAWVRISLTRKDP